MFHHLLGGIMKSISLIVFVAAIMPCTTFAQDHDSYVCSNGDLQRRVVIVRETDLAVPCEVYYFKDTEAPGESQVLWRAMSEEGYCEGQARAFIEQLASWGWNCNAGAVEPDDPEETNEAEAPSAPAEPDVDDDS